MARTLVEPITKPQAKPVKVHMSQSELAFQIMSWPEFDWQTSRPKRCYTHIARSSGGRVVANSTHLRSNQRVEATFLLNATVVSQEFLDGAAEALEYNSMGAETRFWVDEDILGDCKPPAGAIVVSYKEPVVTELPSPHKPQPKPEDQAVISLDEFKRTELADGGFDGLTRKPYRIVPARLAMTEAGQWGTVEKRVALAPGIEVDITAIRVYGEVS